MSARNFFEEKTWGDIEYTLLNDDPLLSNLKKCALKDEELAQLAKDLNKTFSIISGEIQQDYAWEPVRDVITYQHRVLASLTPSGMTRDLQVTVDMSLGLTGIEEKLIGKSVQSVPSKVSFNVKKVAASHPLYFSSGKNLSATLNIEQVLKPPFKLPKIEDSSSQEAFIHNIVIAVRSLPFHLAKPFYEKLQIQRKFNNKAKPFIDSLIQFYSKHSRIPLLIEDSVKSNLSKMGERYDPELELAFVEFLYSQFSSRQRQYEPNVYAKFIEGMFEDNMSNILTNIFKQMEKQHAKIHEDIENYSRIQQEKERLKNLVRDLEMQKSRGASEEVLRRGKQEIKLLTQTINKYTAKYRTAQGIILIQETYINSLEQNEVIGELIEKHQQSLKALKSTIQANHISLRNELEILTRKLGMHAGHLLVQHAVYTDVEPDLDKIVLMDDIGTYDRKEIDVVLNLVPSLKSSIGEETFNSTQLLKSTLNTDIPNQEQQAFTQYIETTDNWKNNVVQRFSQQLENFMEMSKIGNSMDAVAENVTREISTMRTVITYSATENKLNLDFKNHLSYYKAVFIEPYANILEEMQHPSSDQVFRELDKINNNIKTQMNLKYTVAEERAILSMFKQINNQLQLDNLFSTNIFSKQLTAFMTRLKSHKDKISEKLMKKILTSYTVYMMGCSRMHNLARQGQSVTRGDLEKLRHKRKSLTE